MSNKCRWFSFQFKLLLKKYLLVIKKVTFIKRFIKSVFCKHCSWMELLYTCWKRPWKWIWRCWLYYSCMPPIYTFTKKGMNSCIVTSELFDNEQKIDILQKMSSWLLWKVRIQFPFDSVSIKNYRSIHRKVFFIFDFPHTLKKLPGIVILEKRYFCVYLKTYWFASERKLN